MNKKEKVSLINKLELEQSKCKIKDLCLSMEFVPCSTVFGYETYPLCEEADCDVTIENAETYVSLTKDFMLKTGIERQILAIKSQLFIYIFKPIKSYRRCPPSLRIVLNKFYIRNKFKTFIVFD